MKKSSLKGFTLLELIIVIAIIGILSILAMPQYNKFISRAKSVACMSNLRQIGIGVLGYVGENNNTYPIIEPNPQKPVYEGVELDEGITPTPLTEFESYGITDQVLKCPADIAGRNYYKDNGTSYQWRIVLDAENAVAPKMYGGRRGGVRIVKPKNVVICTDYTAVHFGRLNRLYADGHVVAKLGD